MKKVRIGMIGTSWWADFFYLGNLKTHEHAELTAICGRNRTRAEELAGKYGVGRVYTDYRKMLNSGELDAAIVATPEDLHYPMVMTALDAGLHIICEKPMAFTATEAREMLEKAEAVGVKHMVSFTNRWVPGYRHIKHLLETGYIGKPYQALFQWMVDWNLPRTRYLWYFDSQHAHGAASQMGAHIIDLARWYLGEIVRVQANLRSFIPVIAEDGRTVTGENDTATLVLDFANRAQGIIHLSNISPAAHRLFETSQITTLIGEEGSLRADVDPWTKVENIYGARNDQDSVETLPVPDQYYEDVDRDNFWEVFQKRSLGPRAFVDAIINDTPIVPDFFDGYQTQRVIEAALESARSGSAVTL